MSDPAKADSGRPAGPPSRAVARLEPDPAHHPADAAVRPIVGEVWDHPGPRRVPRHSHGRGQLIYPERGSVSVETDDALFVVPPHRAVWVPPAMPHAAWYPREVAFPGHLHRQGPLHRPAGALRRRSGRSADARVDPHGRADALGLSGGRSGSPSDAGTARPADCAPGQSLAVAGRQGRAGAAGHAGAARQSGGRARLGRLGEDGSRE